MTENKDCFTNPPCGESCSRHKLVSSTELDALQALYDALPLEEWRKNNDSTHIATRPDSDGSLGTYHYIAVRGWFGETTAIGKFIVAARQAVPRLIEALREARADAYAYSNDIYDLNEECIARHEEFIRVYSDYCDLQKEHVILRSQLEATQDRAQFKEAILLGDNRSLVFKQDDRYWLTGEHLQKLCDHVKNIEIENAKFKSALEKISEISYGKDESSMSTVSRAEEIASMALAKAEEKE